MCLLDDLNCDCEDRVLSDYRKQREMGLMANAPFVAAVQSFMRVHPETGAFLAMAAVKKALACEPEAGLVDSADMS